MSRRTISIGIDAYERLRAAKRPGESFSDVVDRLVVGPRPSFSVFDGLLDNQGGAQLAKSFARLRAQSLDIDGTRARGLRRRGGRKGPPNG